MPVWARDVDVMQAEAGAAGDAQLSRERLWEIDALRGAAALAVFVFHVSDAAGFDKRQLPAISLGSLVLPSFPNLFSFGATGVSLFFVVSGFCLALQRKRSLTLADYFRQRFARIVPAYWVALLISAILMLSRGGEVGRTSFSTAVHFFFLHGLHPNQFLELNGALWSMATEGQFYLLFPLLAGWQERTSNLRFLVACALWTFCFRLLIASVTLPTVPGFITMHGLLAYQLPGRLLEFALGMWLAREYLAGRGGRYWKAMLCTLPVAAIAGLYCRARGPAWSPDLASGILYTTILGALILSPSRRQPGTAGEMAAWFGRVSYSFFLLHVPLVLFLSEILGRERSPVVRFPVLLIVAFPVCTGAAVLLHRYVEMPMWEYLRGARNGRAQFAEARVAR